MSDYGTMSAQERHKALWQEVAALRISLADMQRRAERAEGTASSMLHELRDVLPSGFRGDNPVWACGKLADRVVDLEATAVSAREREEINKVIINNLHGTIEDLTEDIKRMSGAIAKALAGCPFCQRGTCRADAHEWLRDALLASSD